MHDPIVVKCWKVLVLSHAVVPKKAARRSGSMLSRSLSFV